MAGLSNQPNSTHKEDGLILYNTYLTTALKCVPPGDKPTPKELLTCFNFFKKENEYLKNVNTILALGKIAFDACLNFYKEDFNIKNKDYIFSHGSQNKLPDNKILIGSYHCSRYNTNTKRLTDKMFAEVINELKS